MREIVHIQAGLVAAAAIIGTGLVPAQDKAEAAPDTTVSVVIVSDAAAPAGN